MWFCASIWTAAALFLLHNYRTKAFNQPWLPPSEKLHLVTDGLTTTYFAESDGRVIFRRYHYAKPRSLAGGLLRGLRGHTRKDMLRFISDAQLMKPRKSLCRCWGRRSLAYVARELGEEARLRLHAALHMQGAGEALTVDDFEALVSASTHSSGRSQK